MKEPGFTNYLIRKISKDNVAYQVALRNVNFRYATLKKALLSMYSIIRSAETSFYPLFLGLESTARCNLKCDFCPRTDLVTREVGNMEFGLYRKIIDSVRPVFITLSQLGEPLLHPQIGQMIKYARRKGAIVRITTNATLLNEERCRMLLDSGLNQILISFDSCNKENYEKLRFGADFEEVVANIKRLIGLKKKRTSRLPLISFNVTLNKDNIAEIRELIDFCLKEFNIAPTFTTMYTYGKDTLKSRMVNKSFVDHIKASYLYAEQIKMPSLSENLKAVYNKAFTADFSGEPCFWPYYTTNVSWDGKVYPCCVFFDCQTVLGDFNQQSFKEIWNGKAYRQFRRTLLGGRSAIPLCANCSISDRNINNLIAGGLNFMPFIKPFLKRRFVKIQNQEIDGGERCRKE